MMPLRYIIPAASACIYPNSSNTPQCLSIYSFDDMPCSPSPPFVPDCTCSFRAPLAFGPSSPLVGQPLALAGPVPTLPPFLHIFPIRLHTSLVASSLHVSALALYQVGYPGSLLPVSYVSSPSLSVALGFTR
ncbi:hypothetical protein OH77DRAFT_615068 [Trametes cingulata]|nr:hypothetical protein OH77DRAFT_615068 [Trametes cingulata]